MSQLRNLGCNLGYKVEWKELRACDFGAPTIRKRLFLVARRDGLPISWPQPTHAQPDESGKVAKGLKPWRTAAECIDWSIAAPSIFERERPLADATCRRIAKGIDRYVVKTAKPFIVGDSAPFLTEHANASTQRTFRADEPLRTQMAQIKGGHFALAVPTLVQTGYGERAGQAPRVPGLDKPLGTVVGSPKHALVQAFLAKHYTGVARTPAAQIPCTRSPPRTAWAWSWSMASPMPSWTLACACSHRVSCTAPKASPRATSSTAAAPARPSPRPPRSACAATAYAHPSLAPSWPRTTAKQASSEKSPDHQHPSPRLRAFLILGATYMQDKQVITAAEQAA